MTSSVPIRYRDFWDVPRVFLAQHRGDLFLFDCPFDETTEDYPNQYDVYLLAPLSEEALAGSWESLAKHAVRSLGVVPVPSVRFDATRRREVETGLLDALLADQPEPAMPRAPAPSTP